ncbi:type II secretion system GspH family protein [Acidobacteriia bacterium AH_259_A11_L15]|nr:type II secretion system GspH family protein [Acidobacteriia bacterium AH_259_A11_L15]
MFRRRPQAGLTLLELIVASAILVLLAGMALPLAQAKIRRDKEIQLRRALREMREGIDRYKDAADRGLIAVEAETEGYPPDLETLVEGVALAGAPGRRVRFLRRIPVDPHDQCHQLAVALRAAAPPTPTPGTARTSSTSPAAVTGPLWTARATPTGELRGDAGELTCGGLSDSTGAS